MIDGNGQVPFVVRFCGTYLAYSFDRDAAWEFAESFEKERQLEIGGNEAIDGR